MNLTENAIRVLEARYLRRDERRKLIETPEQMFERVARCVAAAGRGSDGEDFTQAYLQLLGSLDFLPNSPTLMNAGLERGQLSACFVLPIEDTMEGIFEALKRMALIQRTGGGTGFSFSKLRPKGDIVRSTGGEASGPVSFLSIFDSATEHIKQGGKRRGANMGILRVDHPDILEFVRLKTGGKTARNFNLSVGVTDAFMTAAVVGEAFDLVHPATGEVVSQTNAGELFDEIVQAAWASGDPGFVFLDAVNRANPTPQLGDIEATNPCGEIPLLPYEACNLGSINLPNMLAKNEIDWDKLSRTTRLAVRFLDDVIEASDFPFAEISAMVRGNRKIGLGVMGFADLLIKLGVPYDSNEAVSKATQLMGFVNAEALAASEDLARSRGAYPNWSENGPPVRNATRTAIAPTGTIAIIAGVSPGIEPLFALAFRRTHVLGDESLTEINSAFLEKLSKMEGGQRQQLLNTVREHGSLAAMPEAPKSLHRLFVTAPKILPERHLAIQAAFQQSTDNAVSKTVNLPNTAMPSDIASVYRRAWELGLKGVTVFRSGSAPGQVIELGAGDSQLPPACDCEF